MSRVLLVNSAYTWQTVFGRVFFVFTQHVLLIFDIGLLVVGPLFLLFLYNPHALRPSWWLEEWLKFKELRNVLLWAKFWVVVIIGFLLQAVLVISFLKTNKYVRSALTLGTHGFDLNSSLPY